MHKPTVNTFFMNMYIYVNIDFFLHLYYSHEKGSHIELKNIKIYVSQKLSIFYENLFKVFKNELTSMRNCTYFS